MTDIPVSGEPPSAPLGVGTAGVSDAVTRQLAAAVEFRCGAKASLDHTSLVRIDDPTGGVWETQVHIFELHGRDTVGWAYAWPTSVNVDKAFGIRVVLHLPTISSAKDAVLRTLGSRKL